MKNVEKLEGLVAGWLKPLPHLPVNAQKWIADNSWWIVLVGVILSIIGLMFMISALIVALTLVGTTVSYYGYVATGSYGGWWVVNSVIALIFSIGLVALMSTAITPLKTMKAKGWKILFLTLIVNALYIVVNAIFSFSVIGFVFGLIFGAIGLAISSYILFEIKSHFVKSSK